MAEKILEGIKVLDLSQFLSGPRCSQLLALKGADVVKVESPLGETMRLLTRFMNAERMMGTLHQNKRAIVVDLKKKEGVELLKRLARRSDVLVENFAPGLMKKLGLDYEDLKESNPRLVYVSITGFGRTGPLSGRTAFDIIAQASSGIMAAYKMEGRTPKVYFGDLVSGAYAALGAVEALFHRERTGRGQLVDVSMQDVMYFQNFSCFSDRALEPVKDKIEGIHGPRVEPFHGSDRPRGFSQGPQVL
ncbi:MAG: CaiB/BaiF CoA-transferase family protein [bacterium]